MSRTMPAKGPRKPAPPKRPKKPTTPTLADQQAQVKQRVLSLRDVSLKKTQPGTSGKKVR